MDLLNPMLVSTTAGWLTFYEGHGSPRKEIIFLISYIYKTVQGNLFRIFGSGKKYLLNVLHCKVIVITGEKQ